MPGHALHLFKSQSMAFFGYLIKELKKKDRCLDLRLKVRQRFPFERISWQFR